jgi:pimeloyl-ACP methyl ester carboxylesterase
MFLAVLTSFAGAQIIGESYGTGTPAVLALHGWRRDHRDFTPMLTQPSPGLDAIALDLPGFGGTPAPEEAWGSRRYAEALLPVLEDMKPRVVVIGHSLGGRVAVHLAALAPERVAGLVLTGAPLFRASDTPARSPLQFRVVKRLAKSHLVSQAVLERYRQRYGSDDYRAASGVMRDVLVTLVSESYADVLSNVSCPVELVWGETDTVAPLAVIPKIQSALPHDAHLVVCDGVGHMTPASAPGELRAAVERLLP